MNILIVGILCAVSFSHGHQRESGVVMDTADYHHELWINNVKKPMTIIDLGVNQRTELWWWESDVCPPCEAIRMQTVDSEGRTSIFSDNACATNPNPPGMCL